MTVLAWWFDWLPHHGLEDTQRENRYRATRNRVGMEWLFTPLLLSQNYHLVHHLHPSVPFYRYIATWKRNEEAYLERDAAIGTVFGSSSTRTSTASGRSSTASCCACCRCACRRARRRTHAVFHRVPVAAVDRLTADSVAITFDVPEDLRDEFRFEAGQHLTVRTDLGGKDVRRNYSICSPATSDTLRIAVKQIPGGAFSTYAAEELEARRHARADDADRAVRHAAGAAAVQALRRDRSRQRDHPDPVGARHDPGDRDREPLHADLRQPHGRVDDVPRGARRARVALLRPSRDPPRPVAGAQPRRRAQWPHRRGQARGVDGRGPRARQRRRVVHVRPGRARDHGPRHARGERRRRPAHPPRALLRLREERGADSTPTRRRR